MSISRRKLINEMKGLYSLFRATSFPLSELELSQIPESPLKANYQLSPLKLLSKNSSDPSIQSRPRIEAEPADFLVLSSLSYLLIKELDESIFMNNSFFAFIPEQISFTLV